MSLSSFPLPKKSQKRSLVVYFAPHAVCWSKSFVFVLKQVFFIFFHHKRKKRKKTERKAIQKHAKKGGLPAFRCYSLRLVDTQKLVDSSGKCDFFLILFIFLRYFTHFRMLFTGQNTQQIGLIFRLFH